MHIYRWRREKKNTKNIIISAYCARTAQCFYYFLFNGTFPI